MSKFTLKVFCLSLLAIVGIQAAELYKIIELGDGKGNPGPVKLEVNYTNKKSGLQEKIFLETLKEQDIEPLAKIRTSEPVYTRYADHKNPGEEEAKKSLKNKLLPRVGSGESVFPFVLKNEQGEVKGLINIGYGYEKSHRMYGVFTNSGDKTEEGFAEWNTGRGKAAVYAAGAFMMLWHKDHPLHQEITFGDNKIRLWGSTFDILSATSDDNNIAGCKILEALGMKLIPASDPRVYGYVTKGLNLEKNYYELSDINELLLNK